MKLEVLQFSFLLFLRSSEAAGHPKKVQFFNRAKENLHVAFVHPDFPTKPMPKDIIPVGGGIGQETWPGHTFEVSSDGVKPTRVTIVNDGEVYCLINRGQIECTPHWDTPAEEGKRDRETFRGPFWDKLVSDARQNCLKDLDGYPTDAAHFCSEKVAFTTDRVALRSKFQQPDDDVWTAKWHEKQKDRFLSLRYQPASLYNFTADGFEVHDIPDELLKMLRDFWRNGRKSLSKPEISDHFDPNLSPRESDSWHLPLPSNITDRIREVLHPMMSSWAGLDEKDLLFSTMYGLRLYRKGAKLYSHVDRKDTHVLSAILEVGYLGWEQPGVDEEFTHSENWPLDIVAHSGDIHQVHNRPGQMIFYESATCGHGRPTMFPGRESASLFVHYRPEGWPEKYYTPPSDVEL